MVYLPDTAAIAGPWIAEHSISEDQQDRGLAVIAVLPELERTPHATPTRGMVAWVHSGIGACETDKQATATAKLIAAAPELLEALINVRALIVEAAMTGFNCYDGNWAERLYLSQQKTSAAINKAVR